MRFKWRMWFDKLVSKLVAIIYRRLIITTSIVPNKGFHKKELFVTRQLQTNKGFIYFDFYKDRRSKNRGGRFVESYVIGMRVDGNFTDILKNLDKYVIVVTMYKFPYHNYYAISEMLLSIALEEYINIATKPPDLKKEDKKIVKFYSP